MDDKDQPADPQPSRPGAQPAAQPLSAIARITPERAQFRALLLANPNYFGNLKFSPFPAVLNIQSNTTYEEIGCAGFQPQFNIDPKTLLVLGDIVQELQVKVPPQLVTALVIGAVVMQACTLATSIYMHRGLSHSAVRYHPFAEVPLRAILWLTTGMRPRQWAAVHRRHHAQLDTTDDPHSPAILGVWRVQLTNMFLYQRAIRNRAQMERYSRDLAPDRWDRILFDHRRAGLDEKRRAICDAAWKMCCPAPGRAPGRRSPRQPATSALSRGRSR